MDRMRFTSRLTTSDVHFFLIRYGCFLDCTIHEEYVKKDKELICFFSCEGIEYKLFCEDFGLLVTKLQNDVEMTVPETRPSADDWFCFLKSIFGKEYMEHFANVFHAQRVIFEESHFLSQLSYDEMLIIIRQLLRENKRRYPIKEKIPSIIEVESFYRSERRFWIEDGKFYLRISDTEVVMPRMNAYALERFMIDRFGEEYLQACHLNTRTFVVSTTPSFEEYISKEDALASN